MKQAYAPGLEVCSCTTVTKVRELPLAGKSLVKIADKVSSSSAVLQADLPGELEIIRIADRLGFDVPDVLSGMKKSVGDKVATDEIVCQVKSFFGLFSSVVKSPISGTVEFFTEANAHIGIRGPSIPFQVLAYIDGEVVDVKEGRSVTVQSSAAFFQGIFGVGGEREGRLLFIDQPPNKKIDLDVIKNYKSQLASTVVVGGSSFTIDALNFLAEEKISGVVTGSIDAETLNHFVGHEIGVSITGDEVVPFTLIITEGFGNLPISKRILDLVKKLNGRKASINGATQVRAGAMRPEVIITAPDSATVSAQTKNLEIGSLVRVIRVPYFGSFGRICGLPHDPQKVESGAFVRVAELQLEQGALVTVPRANIELV